MNVIGYREVGPRLYEVVLVHGAIHERGRDWPCQASHCSQQIRISDDVPEFDREALADEVAARAYHQLVARAYLPLRPVPFVGIVA